MEACPSLKVLFHVITGHVSYYYYLLLSLLPWQWFSFTLTLYHKIHELFYLWCQTNLKLQEKLCNKCPSSKSSENCSYSDFSCAISGFTSNDRAPGGLVTFWWLMWGQRLPKLQNVPNVPIWLKCAKTAKKCAKLKKSQNHQKQHFQG